MDDKDATILMLAERLYICSRLLTRAAERLGWNTVEVQELVQMLRGTLPVLLVEYDDANEQAKK